MSLNSPWLALSADTFNTPMFDAMPEHGIPERATDGERLAWFALLCYVKQVGRGGTAGFRKSALQRQFDLSERAVDGMLKRAQKCGSITLTDSTVSLVKWRFYQDKAFKGEARRSGENPGFTESGKTREKSTTKDRDQGQGPRTKDNTSTEVAADKPPRKRTPKDDLFDALVELNWGAGVKCPSKQASWVASVASDLMGLGATPDEVRKRFAHLKALYPLSTISALAKHWAEVAAPVNGALQQNRTPAQKRYDELDAAARRAIFPNGRPV